MNKKTDTKIAIAPTISKLKIGESVVFPIERNNAVRNTCSNRSIDLGMTWSTSLNREAGTITVTRTA